MHQVRHLLDCVASAGCSARWSGVSNRRLRSDAGWGAKSDSNEQACAGEGVVAAVAGNCTGFSGKRFAGIGVWGVEGVSQISPAGP